MTTTDLDLARLCASSESSSPSGFDVILDGVDTGIWVAVSHRPDVDIVTFRGSITIEDWWRDGHAEMISCLGLGQLHSGFSKNMGVVLSQLSIHIGDAPIVTGHSLGAARAAIYAGMLSGFNRPRKVTLFGCPRPGGEGLVAALKDIPVFSYKNRLDPVTDVPLPVPPEFPYVHVRDFIHVDGLVDLSLGPPWYDHHISGYVAALETMI